MNKELIKQLANGEVAVKNDGTKDELNKVLKEAFHQGKNAVATFKYYFKHWNTYYEWNCTDFTNLPSYSVKEFLKEEFVLPKKWCVYANEDNIDVIANFYNTANRKFKINTYNKGYVNRYFASHNLTGGQSILSEEPASNYSYQNKKENPDYTEITFEQFKNYVLKEETMENKKIIGYKVPCDINQWIKKGDILTKHTSSNYCKKENQGRGSEKYLSGELVEQWEPVYEEVKTLPVINGYKGEIKGGYLEYGCAKFVISAIKELYKTLKTFNNTQSNAGFDRKVHYITLTSDVKITTSDLEQIVKYLDAKGL